MAVLYYAPCPIINCGNVVAAKGNPIDYFNPIYYYNTDDCRSQIFKLRKIFNSWPRTDINLINALDVVIILRKMKEKLDINIKNICANRRLPIFV